MKRFLLISLLSCLLGGMACAQDCDIHLMAIEANPDGEMPEAAGEYLFNRLCTAITGDGISATGQYAQFFIAAKALPLYEQAVTGAPVKTALTLSLNLYIGDYWGEKVFDRMSLEIRGVGESRERAYLNAFRSLNKNNQQVANFLKKGKQRIIAYYDAEYNNIIREAQRESALRNYERALFLLGAVPVCCNGYDAVADELVKTYHEYIDYNCDRLLMQARNAWAVHPDQRGAAEAARKEISVSRQGWIPKLEIGYRRNTEIRDAVNGFLVGCSIPIFSNHKKVSMAKARSASAQSNLNYKRVTAETEVRSILVEMDQTKAALDAYDETLMRETLVLLRQAVEGGEISLIEYFTEASAIYGNLTACITLQNSWQKLAARLYRNRL